jgi:ribosomal protein S18 acetylase RimI-like enzyme
MSRHKRYRSPAAEKIVPLASVAAIRMIKYRVAKPDEHDRIVRVARRSPYTKDFSNQVMFSSLASYERGWIRVADNNGLIVGFSCIREKVRAPEVVLYFVGVDPAYRRQGIGWGLIKELMRHASHRTLVLKCDRHNKEALALYRSRGFNQYGENAKYLLLRRDW